METIDRHSSIALNETLAKFCGWRKCPPEDSKGCVWVSPQALRPEHHFPPNYQSDLHAVAEIISNLRKHKRQVTITLYDDGVVRVRIYKTDDDPNGTLLGDNPDRALLLVDILANNGPSALALAAREIIRKLYLENKPLSQKT